MTIGNITFETDCFSFGPTTGGGRIYNKKGPVHVRERKRSDASRKRKSLKNQYRHLIGMKVVTQSFKEWLKLMEQKPARRARLRTHQTA